MNAVNPSVASCDHREQVLDSGGVVFADAAHHRRRGAHPLSVRLPVDTEPLNGRNLGVRPDPSAGFVFEDLGAPSRNRLQARCPQARDHMGERQPLALRDVPDLRSRERVKVNRGEGRFELPQQPFVEVDSQGWMVASLEQDPGPPGRDGFVDLLRDHLERQDVCALLLGFVAKDAEAATVDTDIGVVDVAVDDGGDLVPGVHLTPDGVGHRAELVQGHPPQTGSRVAHPTTARRRGPSRRCARPPAGRSGPDTLRTGVRLRARPRHGGATTRLRRRAAETPASRRVPGLRAETSRCSRGTPGSRPTRPRALAPTRA